MKSQLYVPEMTRRYLKSEVSSYADIYFKKLLPVFGDIENDADRYSSEFYENFMSQPAFDDSVDPASIAERALDIGLHHYSYLKLGKYNLTATWHSTLYELWEQQLRLFLFREMSHVYKIEFGTFCKCLKEIKKNFKLHNVDIESFSCWPQIEELRLLCNVIKHGHGGSAQRLRKINPALFRHGDTIDYMELYKTTLLEEVLNVDENTLLQYKQALLSFWDEIPERNYREEI